MTAKKKSGKNQKNLSMKKIKNSLVFLSILLCLSNLFPLDLISTAKKCELEKDYKKASELYQKYLVSDSPNVFTGMLHVINIEPDIQRTFLIVNKYFKRLSSKSEKSIILLKVAQLQEEIGLYEEAAKNYEKSFYISSVGDYRILLRSALLLIENGEFGKASRQLNRIVSESDNNEIVNESKINIARILFTSNRAKALNILDGILNITYGNKLYFLSIYLKHEMNASVNLKIDRKYSNSLVLLLIGSKISNYPTIRHYLMGNGLEDKSCNIQTGLFSSIDNARVMIRDLKNISIETNIVKKNINERTYYKVIVPNVPCSKVETIMKILKKQGFEGIIVKN